MANLPHTLPYRYRRRNRKRNRYTSRRRGGASPRRLQKMVNSCGRLLCRGCFLTCPLRGNTEPNSPVNWNLRGASAGNACGGGLVSLHHWVLLGIVTQYHRCGQIGFCRAEALEKVGRWLAPATAAVSDILARMVCRSVVPFHIGIP